jgi:hypothetical protein
MLYPILLFLLSLNWLINPYQPVSEQVGKGFQPSVTTTPDGVAHIVYGQNNVIFYTTSRDGETFSEPMRIDSLPGLHLGASRGPQIAATNSSVVITAVDKPGNVWAYTLNRNTNRWQPRVRINDIPEVAKEGFVALTTTDGNTYMAAWLDLRSNNRNKLVGARSTDDGKTWTANQVLYQSPDGTVCECCQMSIVSQGSQVAIMFRNFLNGSRDMYVLTSTDNGHTFGKPKKLGKGTWKLNACPMDGGGLAMNPTGAISTVWRRHDTLFTAKQDQAEVRLATGKNPKIVSTAIGDYIVFQQANQIMALLPSQSQLMALGAGAYPKLIALPKGVLCLWEQNGDVQAQLIR